MAGFRDGYALIIGIANYPKVRKLPETVLKDARDVRELLRSPSSCGYLDENVHLLLDDRATADRIRAKLHWLAQSAVSGKTAVVYFSGHGGRVEGGSQAVNYIIPYDCDLDDLDGTAITGQELTKLLCEIKSQRLLVVFDSCYSGGTAETKGLGPQRPDFKSGLAEDYYHQLTQGAGRVIMASSRFDEESLVIPGMNNSLFTHYLLESLRGKARTRGDGLIRVFDIFAYVSEEVPARDSRQHPIFKATDLEQDFPIALYLGGKSLRPGAISVAIRRTRVDKRVLRKKLAEAFGLEDLDLLCADIEQDLTHNGIKLQVNLEIVGGNGKEAKILNLITYLERRNYLDYLVDAIRRERPGIELEETAS